MEEKSSKEGKRVAWMVIIVLALMAIITLYEFVQCASGKKGHDKWDNVHVQVVKPIKKSVNNFILFPPKLPYIINKV